MFATDHGHQGERIGIFGRRGTGKTTIAVLLARHLHTAPHEVAVLDADPTNGGLAQAAGATAPSDHLLTLFDDVDSTIEVSGSLTRSHLDLRWLPMRYVSAAPDGIRILTAGKAGPADRRACDLVTRIGRDVTVHDAGDPLTTVIDFGANPSAATIDLLATLDWVIVTLDPTFASLRLAQQMNSAAMDIRREASFGVDAVGTPPLIGDAPRNETARLQGMSVVLNRVGSRQQEEALRQHLELREIGVAAVVPEDRALCDLRHGGVRIDARRISAALEPLADEVRGHLASPALSLPGR